MPQDYPDWQRAPSSLFAVSVCQLKDASDNVNHTKKGTFGLE